MQVVKSNGKTPEALSRDKIFRRVNGQSRGLYVIIDKTCDIIMRGLFDKITTSQIDHYIASVCASLSTHHYDYTLLAARIEISRLHKTTPARSFRESIIILQSANILTNGFDYTDDEWSIIETSINHNRDGKIDYFGFKTMEKLYLLHVNEQCVELPQYMYMRVALSINQDEPTLASAIETYNLLSAGFYTHATPTLQNAGTRRGQLSSCFLMPVRVNSISDIYDTLKEAATIGAEGGGLGMNISHIPSSHSSSGIIPILRLYDNMSKLTAESITSANARHSPIAMYLEPWHPEIFSFLNLRKNVGASEMRTRNLFTALWIPDLFMNRVRDEKNWSLFCPSTAPGLDNVYGHEFDMLYAEYEKKKLAVHVVSAQSLWRAIVEAQIETGTPYILFKDAANVKSNHRHLGPIKCSNLCTEIIQYSNESETAVCNLASIAVNMMIKTEVNTGIRSFDFQVFARVVMVVVCNLNRVIETTKYPTSASLRSNTSNRPIGIGIQGLADLFMELRLPYESTEARMLNRHIFEQLYFSALDASCKIAEVRGSPCKGFFGSPMAKGILQFDLWNAIPVLDLDYDCLRKRIKKFGTINTLLVAPMPTATTATVLSNTESFEPLTNNFYVRRVLHGTFQVINRHLIQDLTKLGMWNDEMRRDIIRRRGSVQEIQTIPEQIRHVYKTVWEMSTKNLIDMAADRAPFIDQSQSFNVYVSKPTYSRISTLHFYSWRSGLKTGCYYLRTLPAASAIQFTVSCGDTTSDNDKNECTSCSA